MPTLGQVLVHLPEAACLVSGGAILGFSRGQSANAPFPRRVALGALLVVAAGVVWRAPLSGDGPLSPDTLGRLGLPLLVWFALLVGAGLAQGRPRPARAADLAWLLLLGAPLLRLATWPGGDTAVWALGLALVPWAMLARSAWSGLQAGILGCALVATGAGLAPYVDALVWHGTLPSAVPAWAGAGVACAALTLTLIGPQTPRRILLGVSCAQLALLIAATAVSTRHAMFGALAGAAWAWLAPLLALWALVIGLEESPEDVPGRLARNRPQLAAAGLAFFALCGVPLTPGFAARTGLAEASLRAGLTWPTALGGLALLLLAIVGVRAYFRFGLKNDEPAPPWVFDHHAARTAAFLPWALVILEFVQPGLCGGGAWAS
ncbi:MAG: hypothetical protein JKY65_18730 [Planctomycetes bacterium]|nr:hypothetical protein [Planctomycetota bacterium]